MTTLPQTPLVDAARALARSAHHGQTRHDGTPYIHHPEAVAGIAYADSHGKPPREREIIVAIALLHDVLEDTAVREFDIESRLRVQGQAAPAEIRRIMAALHLLTRRAEEPYKTFIGRASTDPLSRAVKLADLAHNLADGGGPRKSLRSRYEAARRHLQQITH